MSLVFDLARPVLRALSPETAHDLTLVGLRLGFGGAKPTVQDPALAQSLWGLSFPNPLGLAAGFDKNALVPDAMLGLGLGFVECGTVTPRPQTGNPRPRIFRLPEDEAVINRLGFNNRGLEAMVRRLKARTAGDGVVGINLGANKDSADKVSDYCRCLEAVYPFAQYVTINVSSPNTPGLRGLQDRPALEALLGSVMEMRARLSADDPAKPVLLKVAPDLAPGQAEDIAEVVLQAGIDGLIVSNTTTARPDTLQGNAREEQGGLSGRPLFEPSTALLARFYRLTEGRVPLVGVGGVDSARSAYAKIQAGASLVQLYTALIYRGPALIDNILRGLSDLLGRDGFPSVMPAIGTRADQWTP